VHGRGSSGFGQQVQLRPLSNPDPGGMLISPGQPVFRRPTTCHRPGLVARLRPTHHEVGTARPEPHAGAHRTLRAVGPAHALLVTAGRMTGHADQVEAQVRGHKQLMDDYKAGRIDRATAFPQGSWWRKALAFTLQQGVAAADQYDADKAAYRRLAAQCSKDG
jgi:hypothetical protein